MKIVIYDWNGAGIKSMRTVDLDNNNSLIVSSDVADRVVVIGDKVVGNLSEFSETPAKKTVSKRASREFNDLVRARRG
jgi:hypothetical protein